MHQIYGYNPSNTAVENCTSFYTGAPYKERTYIKVKVSSIYDSVRLGVPVRENICPEPPA